MCAFHKVPILTNHLMLIDASGFAHRAFHSGARQYRESDGLPTWAITGFLGLMWRLLGAAQADQPTHAAAVFDTPEPTFRHRLFPEYKANRPGRAEELAAQIPFMRHAAETMGITSLDLPGYEGDDIIATLAYQASKAGARVTIVSSDKDYCQLVRNGLVEIIDPMARRRIREAEVRDPRKFGVWPSQVPDVQAIAGDAVDNIPGLRGMGIKTAAFYVRRFGNIEGVVQGARDEPANFSPSHRRLLKAPETIKWLRLYRTLARLALDAPIELSWTGTELRPILRSHVLTLLQTLGAEHRFNSIFRETSQKFLAADRIEPHEAFAWWREELAVAGQPVPDLPQCGFYERRMVRGGVFVPARIWREDEVDPVTHEPTGAQVIRCEVGGELYDPALEWPVLAQYPISAEKYAYEMADFAWARQYAPSDPKSNPSKPIDICAQPVPRCPQLDRKRRKRSR